MQTNNDSEESTMQRDGEDETMTEKVMGRALNI